MDLPKKVNAFKSMDMSTNISEDYHSFSNLTHKCFTY